MSAFPHTQQWCQGKPLIIRVLAKLSLAGSDDICWGLNMLRERKIHEKWSVPDDPEAWLKFYTRSHQILGAVAKARFHGDEGTLAMLGNVWAAFYQASKLPQSVREAYIQSLTQDQLNLLYWRSVEWWRKVERRMDNNILREIGSDELPEHLAALIPTPMFQFFIRVWGPCFVLYGQRPSQLLRRARNGDVQAAIDLVRIDRSVLFDPKIKMLMYKHGQRMDAGIQEQIAEASTKPPYPPAKLWSMKAKDAGLLLHLARAIKYRLTPKAIRGWFNAMATDLTGKADPDLPKDEAAFKKSLYRARDFWAEALDRDKRFLPNVPLI